jgi:hypothetical protein
VAQLGSALDWGSSGRRFKSCQPDTQLQVTGGSGESRGRLFCVRAARMSLLVSCRPRWCCFGVQVDPPRSWHFWLGRVWTVAFDSASWWSGGQATDGGSGGGPVRSGCNAPLGMVTRRGWHYGHNVLIDGTRVPSRASGSVLAARSVTRSKSMTPSAVLRLAR